MAERRLDLAQLCRINLPRLDETQQLRPCIDERVLHLPQHFLVARYLRSHERRVVDKRVGCVIEGMAVLEPRTGVFRLVQHRNDVGHSGLLETGGDAKVDTQNEENFETQRKQMTESVVRA